MEPLPKGISGFASPEHGIEFSRFKAACEAVARRIKGKVKRLQPCGHGNFHEALMTTAYEDETIRVLCNAHYPFITFATPNSDANDLRIQFLDCPALAEAFENGFTVLRKDDAFHGAAENLICNLDAVERKQMRYWRINRIGEIVFNYWD